MINTIPMTIVESYHNALLNDANLLKGMTNLGFSQETIERFKLGYDAKKQRLTIPIIVDSICHNIRFYSRKQKPKY